MTRYVIKRSDRYLLSLRSGGVWTLSQGFAWRMSREHARSIASRIDGARVVRLRPRRAEGKGGET